MWGRRNRLGGRKSLAHLPSIRGLEDPALGHAMVVVATVSAVAACFGSRTELSTLCFPDRGSPDTARPASSRPGAFSVSAVRLGVTFCIAQGLDERA